MHYMDAAATVSSYLLIYARLALIYSLHTVSAIIKMQQHYLARGVHYTLGAKVIIKRSPLAVGVVFRLHGILLFAYLPSINCSSPNCADKW